MSPTLKGLETTLSRILSHAKLCRCLIHLPLFPLPTNNIMAVVSDVQKQKIGMGMTLATQQHLLASSAQTAIPECMNAQSLIISQKEEVTRREWCICFVVHTGCSMPVCSQNPQGFKGVHGNPSPHRCQLCKVVATRSHGLSDIFMIINSSWNWLKAFKSHLLQYYTVPWWYSLRFWSEDGGDQWKCLWRHKQTATSLWFQRSEHHIPVFCKQNYAHIRLCFSIAVKNDVSAAALRLLAHWNPLRDCC